MIEVLPPHGFVKLIKWQGTELDIVNAARVSFGNETDSLEQKDVGLINFLMRERHGTPFEMGFNAHWHIRAPLSVFYEWHRHRIGISYNEESGRYVELRPDFYIPKAKNVRTQVGKPGAYHYEEVPEETARLTGLAFKRIYQKAYEVYDAMISAGIAKELARNVLPVGIFKEMRVVTNARSLMNFLALRNSEHAMYEIRVYAEAMEDSFAECMPNVHSSFIKNGRNAP